MSAEPRPGRLVLVVGTGTEVGKTWVSARLLSVLRAGGLTVAARKPAQSFDPGDDPATTDAAVLAGATGEHPTVVCPPRRWYPVAMAPPMAAEVLGRPPFSLAELVAELAWAAGGDRPGGVPQVGVVETAGGVGSPQAVDGDAVDLARLLNPDVVVLVADAGLGTINAVRLAVGALARGGADPAGRRAPVTVVLNRYDEGDDLHRRNRRWLAEREGLDVVVAPGGLEALATSITRRPPAHLEPPGPGGAGRGRGSAPPSRSG
ncbi:MAG: ATP-dependent dethiobiotin synthetase BioD [Acidimicrobiales bacterium]